MQITKSIGKEETKRQQVISGLNVKEPDNIQSHLFGNVTKLKPEMDDHADAKQIWIN